MAFLERVVNSVEAIVHQHFSKPSEMNVDGRMNIIGEKGNDEPDGGRRLRAIDLEQAHREGDEKRAEKNLYRVTDVVRRMKFRWCVVHHVDRPEPPMLRPVPPISEEVRDRDQCQKLQRIA